jgi:putative glycosyltransferase (TIGR04372 family)
LAGVRPVALLGEVRRAFLLERETVITQAQVDAGLIEAENVLLEDPTNQAARQWLFSAYWQLADLYYNRGDFDGHIHLLRSIIDVSERVAQQTALEQYPQRFISWEGTCGLGHLAQGLDIHVKARELKMRPTRPTVILAHPDVVANSHYLGYYAPYFDKIITNPKAIQALMPLGGARGYFGALEDHFVVTRLASGQRAYCEAAWEVQAAWEAKGRTALLQLSAEDTLRGYDWLKSLGMPSGAWFAVLHVRESNHWDHAHGRNVALSDYFTAVASIVEHGGWVVRLGNPQMTPLPPMPHVIDYAHQPDRADWKDVFLLGGARFMLGTQSGPAEVPPTFGVPTLLTNWQIGFRPGHKTDTVIFKRYKVGGKILTMEQALEQRYAFIETPGMYVPGVEVVSNTPEEIRQLVDEWLEGTALTDAQRERQKNFDERQRRAMAAHEHQPAGYCRVGRGWLEKVMAEE